MASAAGSMMESFHWFQGELFDLITEDLLRLPAPLAPAGMYS
jgi:hypothetical protein